jgi:hypothetical protein
MDNEKEWRYRLCILKDDVLEYVSEKVRKMWMMNELEIYAASARVLLRKQLIQKSECRV